VTEPAPYLSGLVLTGRRVVLIGGGGVAQRRLPRLLETGARIEVISPAITPTIEGLLTNPDLRWIARGYQAGRSGRRVVRRRRDG
jgi:uroporphyrin-III C-methyltransferase/precorrin-2 dehydrogenase/sirohydrochlorin ferrochelatase